MAFSYPYSFVAKTVARANQVMANFDAIKEVLDGGISKENLAPGYMPSAAMFTEGAVTMGTQQLNAVVMPAKTISVDALSVVKIDFKADIETFGNVSTGVVLEIDGSRTGSRSILAPVVTAGGITLRAPCAESWCGQLAAGSHTVRLVADNSSATVIGFAHCWESTLTYIAIPHG